MLKYISVCTLVLKCLTTFNITITTYTIYKRIPTFNVTNFNHLDLFNLYF